MYMQRLHEVIKSIAVNFGTDKYIRTGRISSLYAYIALYIGIFGIRCHYETNADGEEFSKALYVLRYFLRLVGNIKACSILNRSDSESIDRVTNNTIQRYLISTFCNPQNPVQ